MGNSASALPYTIGEETHPSGRTGSYGFAIHNGSRKSDGLPVTVFKGTKSNLAQTPLLNKGSTASDPSLTQIFPALHHFHKIKTLIHPHLLKVYATLDTDNPNVNDGKDGTNSSSTTGAAGAAYISNDSFNPASLSALQQTPTTGDLIIVTEPVIPLPEYLDALQADTTVSNTQRADAVAWGICNLIQGLTFLHNHAKVAHGNLCPHAIFVTPSGDFKLSGLHLLTPIGIADGATGPTPHFRHFERDITPNMYRSPERIECRWDAISTSPIHIMDAYSMGILLPEIYSHIGAGTNGKLPTKLDKACRRLASQAISGRPRVAPLAKCPVLDTEFNKAQRFMDSMATQDVESKIIFWKTLPDLLQTKKVLTSRVAKYKILPMLQSTITNLTSLDAGLAQDVNKRECLAILPTLFTASTAYLTPMEFQTQLSPLIELLFRVNDRAVRGALLSRIGLFVKLLDAATLNRVVFEPMCSGFSDSSAPLRELTLKSAIVLVDHLTPANLEKLTRYLIRLQSDAEDSIRTNTVIFIGKVAPTLSDMARSKLILPAFTRAMNDGFVPCRLAGLKAICACRDYFEEQDLATDVLPAISPSLVDMNEEVRIAAMRAIEELLEILRAVGVKMSEEEQKRAMLEGNNLSGTSAGGSGLGSSISAGSLMGRGSSITNSGNAMISSTNSASAGYLSGLGSWASSKITSSTASTSTNTNTNNTTTASSSYVTNGTNQSMTSSLSSSAYTSANPTPSVSAPVTKSAPKFTSLGLRDAGVGGGNGWANDDDDDDDFGDDLDNMHNKNTTNSSSNVIPSWASQNDDADDDFMAQFEKKGAIRPRSIGGASGKLTTPSRVTAASRRRAELVQKKTNETKVSVTKLAMDNNIDDGWDDF